MSSESISSPARVWLKLSVWTWLVVGGGVVVVVVAGVVVVVVVGGGGVSSGAGDGDGDDGDNGMTLPFFRFLRSFLLFLQIGSPFVRAASAAVSWTAASALALVEATVVEVTVVEVRSGRLW